MPGLLELPPLWMFILGLPLTLVIAERPIRRILQELREFDDRAGPDEAWWQAQRIRWQEERAKRAATPKVEEAPSASLTYWDLLSQDDDERLP